MVRNALSTYYTLDSPLSEPLEVALLEQTTGVWKTAFSVGFSLYSFSYGPKYTLKITAAVNLLGWNRLA